MPAPFDFPVGDLPEADPVRMRVADVIAQVHPQFPLPFSLESISLAAGTRQGCQFHRHILHPDPVIAKSGRFVFLGKRDRLRKRSEKEIAQVHTAGTAQVRMGEADQRRILVPVARSGFPARIVRIRAQLDHSEGRRRPGIGMAVATRADEGIDAVQGRFRRPDDQHPVFLVRLGRKGPVSIGFPDGQSRLLEFTGSWIIPLGVYPSFGRQGGNAAGLCALPIEVKHMFPGCAGIDSGPGGIPENGITRDDGHQVPPVERFQQAP